MEKITKNLSKYLWVSVFILTLPAAWSLLVPGFFGASDDMHIAWLYEMDQVIKLGQIPPRFAPDLSFGFGYPLFNFVFPLPFYIAELFHLLSFSLVDSIKAVFFISLPLSALFMYKFLREFTSQWLSLAGAIVFVFTPYRSTDIYVRGAIGESLSFVILPLIALSIVKLTTVSQKLNFRWIALGGLALAALILCHNITAYMFLPFILLLIFLRSLFSKTNKLYILGQLSLMVTVGLLLSIYFWLPALLDSRLMVYDTVFNFVDHFPTIRQLTLPHWGYGASVPGPGDGMSFFIGSMNWVLLLLGGVLTLLFWKKYSANQKTVLVWSLISFAASFVMMNYRSLFIWQNVPLLPYFQFPWRFLIITTFMTPLLVISLEKIKFNLWLSVGIVMATIFLNTAYFKPHDFLGRQDDYYLNRYIPIPEASFEYRKTGEEYLRLSKSTDQRPAKNYPLVTIIEGEVKSVKQINSLSSLIEIEASKDALLTYNKYFFPGWRARLDDKDVSIKVGQPFGQIEIPVSPGQHQLKINFQQTLDKKILDIVSLLTFVVVIKFLLFRPKGYNNSVST